MRLLLIEDDLPLAMGLIRELRRVGYALVHVATAGEGAFLLGQASFDVVILDLGLPDRSGLELLRELRGQGMRLPVLILSARDSWRERVDGLKLGADDYLGKPFHQEELVARIQALIRRATGLASSRLEVAGVSLDEETRHVQLNQGPPLVLTATEFRLLRYFLHHPGHVLSKDQLIAHVFNQDANPSGNLIEVYVKRLREKIGTDRIRTLRGQGYLFVSHA